MLKAGLIGFGGITKAHRKAFAKLEQQDKARLTCAYDIDPMAFERKKEINLGDDPNFKELPIRFYADLEQMLQKEDLDFVDICVPSYMHAPLSCEMLRRGYHVMCEKPMALTYADCKKMLAAAKESKKELMIGQCLRFYPEYQFIKEAVDDQRFGAVLSAFFNRLSAPPTWGWENWFMDPARSGGCITDLHIHDIDMIRYLFGEPEAVSCRTTDSVSCHDTVQTALFYGKTPITAMGDWTLTGLKFSASCRVDFAGATVIYDGKMLTVYPKDGTEPYRPQLEKTDGHTGELFYFCDVLLGLGENTRNPASGAARSVRLIEIMRESAAAAGAVMPVNEQSFA